MALQEEYIRKIKFLQDNLTRRMYSPLESVEFQGFFTYDRLSLQEAEAREKMPLPEGMRWGRKWEYGWFFAEVDVPPAQENGEHKRTQDVKMQNAGEQNAEDGIFRGSVNRIVFRAEPGECLVFINGQVKGALDKEHKIIELNEYAGQKIQIAMEVYAGHSGEKEPYCARAVLPDETELDFPEDICQKTVKNGSMGIFREEVFQLWMDLNTLYGLRNCLDPDSLRRARLEKALKRACNQIDIELPDRESEFAENVLEARKSLRDVLSGINGSTAPIAYAIGHSHLDLQWLWTVEETRRKVARTLGNQLQLLKEYKDYKYLQTQPWQLSILKEEYPDLYAQVKEAVRDGRILVDGGMWVEADVNLPSGESLVRQLLYGKTFLQEEFGTESRMLWLPDVFGVSGALPQIMKGCGIRYFMNAKLPWLYDGGEAIPHHNFIWKGIDGTGILTHITYDYAAEMTPVKIIEKWKANPEKEDVPAYLYPFGHGDGGGGATRVHLEYLKREKNLEGMPRVECKSPEEFFSFVEKDCDMEAEYRGELYFAAHRGTYTSQAETKKNNRTCEMLLRETELWLSLCCPEAYDKELLDSLWKKLLFNQFHDIIPGSAIHRVYEIAKKDYQEIKDGCGKLLEKAIHGSGDCGYSTEGAWYDDADPLYSEQEVQKKTGLQEEKELQGERELQKEQRSVLTVYNALSWDREVCIELPEGYRSILGMDGQPIKTQELDGKVLAFVTIPSVGYRNFEIRKEDNGKDSMIIETGSVLMNGKSISKEWINDGSGALDGFANGSGEEGFSLENAMIRADFDEHGTLLQLTDKETGVEYLTAPSNVFRMYRDMPLFFDAWDINSSYEKEEVELPEQAEVESVWKGSLVSGFKTVRKIGKSVIHQTVILAGNSRQLTFETEVDWQETHKLLKVDMNTNLQTDELLSEIQFGHVRRPNHKSRPYDADRFEVCQHKWSAFAEPKRGIALLNDCKYGISADSGRMSLTLLKSAAAPDPFADKGIHKFTYALLPFAGEEGKSDVVRHGYELNCPVHMVQEKIPFAQNLQEKSFIRIDNPSVILDTVKLAEDGSGDLVLRLYESTGGLEKAKISFGFPVVEADFANLLEKGEDKLSVENNGINVTLKAFEIKTIRIRRV